VVVPPVSVLLKMFYIDEAAIRSWSKKTAPFLIAMTLSTLKSQLMLKVFGIYIMCNLQQSDVQLDPQHGLCNYAIA